MNQQTLQGFAPDLFAGQVALVTGGGSGIGWAIARQLLGLGAHVLIASRKPERIDSAVAELSAFGRVEGFTLDIREPEQCLAAVDEIRQRAGRLDILVNNAGGQFPSPAEAISTKGWLAVINNNLNGTWHLTQAMANAFFIPQRRGAVTTVTANVFRGFPGMAHTGAARAGIENFTQTLAVEWAPHRIRLNCVAPGLVESSGLQNYPPEMQAHLRDTWRRKIPMKRLASVDEVAQAVVFLSSPLASYITGVTLAVDGGQRLWGDLWEVPEFEH